MHFTTMYFTTSILAFVSAALIETQLPIDTPFIVSQATSRTSAGGKAVCVRGKINVTASAVNTKLLITSPATQAELTQTTLDIATASSDYMTRVISGPNLVSGTF